MSNPLHIPLLTELDGFTKGHGFYKHLAPNGAKLAPRNVFAPSGAGCL